MASVTDDSRCTDLQLDTLWAAIQVNDLVADVAAPPKVPGLDIGREQILAGFGISRQLWRQGFDRADLLAMVQMLARGGRPDPGTRLRFKHVRARFKHLRFAFVLYGIDHSCPMTLKAITTAMGHLQDALKGGQAPAIRRFATILRHLLGPLPQALMQREVGRLEPCDPDGYRRFVLSQIATLRGMLEAAAMTGHQFHAARKVVSRQVSFHDDMRALTGRKDHEEMARFLAAINGLMGSAHDALVLDRTAGRSDYARRSFALSPDIRQRLTALVALYPCPEAGKPTP